MRKMMILALASVLIVGALGLSQAYGQPRERDEARRGDRRDRGTPEERQKRMDDFRKRMDDRMREGLGASEDEWKVLQPRIEKVQGIQRQSRGGFRGRGGMAGRRGRGDEGRTRTEGTPERVQPEIEKKTQALRSLLEDKASGAQAIKAALAALRTARDKNAKDLALARKQLQEVCTMRQEAQLVMMNILQ